MSTVLIARGVADGLVQNVDNPRKHVHDVRADFDLMQSDTKVCCHLAGVDGVVGHRFETLILGTECDGVGLDGGVPARRHRGDEARVQAAAEKGRDRYVSDHVSGD